MVVVSASVNLPLHHKVQRFSSGTGSPGWSRKKGHKTFVVWWFTSETNLKLAIIWRRFIGLHKGAPESVHLHYTSAKVCIRKYRVRTRLRYQSGRQELFFQEQIRVLCALTLTFGLTKIKLV